MYLSVQLSYYPLADDEFDEVMAALSDVMKWSFETHGKAVFTANFLKGDRRPR